MNDATDPLVGLTNDAHEDVRATVYLWCREGRLSINSDRGNGALCLAAESRSSSNLTATQLLRILCVTTIRSFGTISLRPSRSNRIHYFSFTDVA